MAESTQRKKQQLQNMPNKWKQTENYFLKLNHDTPLLSSSSLFFYIYAHIEWFLASSFTVIVQC